MRNIIILVHVSGFILFSACGQKGPLWIDTLSRQIAQPGSIPQVDSAVFNFMAKYNIPGMSVAIAKDGKMIYARGYGFANKSTAEEVTKTTLFRIGRTSEFISAIAIMKLIGEGRLSLASKVFGDSGILGNQHGRLPNGSNIKNITIDQLLHHSVGGWAGDDDAMWKPKYLDNASNPGELISFALMNIPLRTPPGSVFDFSDLGYLVLGRVIEKVSGLAYGDFVKKRILDSLGISDMHIESNSADEIRKNEAVYYADIIFPIFRSEKVDDETYHYTALGDACYGWIASAEDLLKIVVNTGDSTSKVPVLSPAGSKMLLSTGKTNPHVGCGINWNADLKNWYDLGSYRGSSAEFVHAANGYCWAILVNTYRPAIDAYLSDMDHIVWSAIGNPKTQWPDKELF